MQQCILPRWTSAALVCCLLAGCGGGGNTLHTVPVTGTVTLNGEPLAGATVLFAPNDAGGVSAMGTTDEQGRYTLSQASNQGALPGTYKVVIEHYTTLDGKPIPTSEDPAAQMDVEQLRAQGQVKQTLPPKYSGFDQSELNATVKEEGENKHDFPLTSG